MPQGRSIYEVTESMLKKYLEENPDDNVFKQTASEEIKKALTASLVEIKEEVNIYKENTLKAFRLKVIKFTSLYFILTFALFIIVISGLNYYLSIDSSYLHTELKEIKHEFDNNQNYTSLIKLDSNNTNVSLLEIQYRLNEFEKYITPSNQNLISFLKFSESSSAQYKVVENKISLLESQINGFKETLYYFLAATVGFIIFAFTWLVTMSKLGI